MGIMLRAALNSNATELHLPAIDWDYGALENALDSGNIPQIVDSLQSLKRLLATNKSEQLNLLIAAEDLLSSSPHFAELREDLLLGLINRTRALGFDDLLMSSLGRMSQLLEERRSYEAANVCSAQAGTLHRIIFGEHDSRSLKPPPTRTPVVGSVSSSDDRDGSIPFHTKAFQAITFIGTLTQANLALERGYRHFQDEKWQAAKGDFMTAAMLIDCPEPTVNDGILLQAQAESMLAACYLKTFEHELAIPFARHAVSIYMNNPHYRTPALYRYALETLEEALSLDPENYEELQELREIIASFNE